MPTTALSAWFLAELRLARVSIKADEAQLKIESQLRRALEGLIGPAINGIIAELQRTGQFPTTPGATEALIDALRDDVATAMSESGTKAALIEARTVTGNPNFNLDDFSPAVRNQLSVEAFRTASERTLNQIKGNVTQALAEAYEQGLGIDTAASNLRSVFSNLKTYELERIARTEINAAQNTVAAMTIAELGLRYHQWIATMDDRVRESHEDLHLVIVQVGDLFPNGLLHPGDTNGPPDEFINCRCRIRPYIMPAGKMAPAGLRAFREADLIERPTVDETRVVEPELQAPLPPNTSVSDVGLDEWVDAPRGGKRLPLDIDESAPYTDAYTGPQLGDKFRSVTETTNVPIKTLTATQADVSKSAVQSIIDEGWKPGPIYETPVIFQYQGKQYIHDGHHRIAARLLLGYDDIDARFVNLDLVG